MTRRTYNQATAAWFRNHPTLAHLRQLSGKDDLTEQDDAAAYAAEQSAPEADDCVKDYADRRGV